MNRQLDQTLVKLMNAGQLNIDLHFLNFQDNKSSDNYSNRAFNGAIYIAEHDDDPDHLMSYLSNIYAEDFQPGELSNYEPVSNAKLEKQAVKAGVSEDVAAAAFSGKNEYLDWLTASNNYTILRPELFNSSGAFSSPTLTINGEYWDLKQLTLADTSMVDGFLKSIGLDADQVGVEGKMPSIGADGKPISVASLGHRPGRCPRTGVDRAAHASARIDHSGTTGILVICSQHCLCTLGLCLFSSDGQSGRLVSGRSSVRSRQEARRAGKSVLWVYVVFFYAHHSYLG